MGDATLQAGTAVDRPGQVRTGLAHQAEMVVRLAMATRMAASARSSHG